MKRLLIASFVFLLGTIPSFSQGVRKDDIASINVSNYMVVVPYASIRVCQNRAIGLPCTPLASVYSNSALTNALPNPFPADANGNYFFYALPGTYMIQVTTVGGTGSYPDQTLPNLPSVVTTTFNYISVPFSSNPNFSFVPNSMFQMVLTGNVTGSTLTGGPVPGATAMFSVCQDSSGGHSFSFPSGFVLPSGFALNTVANSCNNLLFTYDGTNWQGIGGGGGGGGGGGSFGLLTGGVNTSAVMTLGNGGILTFTTGGIVNASRIVGIDFTSASGCNSITYLRGDGLCQTPAGSGNVSTSTGTSYLTPTWLTSTTLGSISAGIAGQPLLSGGGVAADSHGALNLASSNNVTGLLSNVNIANTTTTVNSQSCTLGASCTIPFQVNTNGGNTSQAGVNLTNSSANTTHLSWSVTNPSTNVEQGEIGGSLNLASLYWPTPTNPNDTICPNGSSGGVDCVTGIVLGNSGSDVTTTYTVGCDGTAKPDRGKEIETSGTFTLTVPAVSTTGCQNGFPFFIANISGTLTVSSASNFSIITGSGAPTIATSFAMSQGMFATIRNVDNASWRVYEVTASGNAITSLTADGTATGPGAAALTLATVNGSPGSTTCSNITTNGKGLVTANANGSCSGGGGGIPYGTGAGSVNAMTVTTTPAVATNAAGTIVEVLPNLANTNATPTLNVGGAGPMTIVRGPMQYVLSGGDYTATRVAIFISDGTHWQLLNSSNPLETSFTAGNYLVSGSGSFRATATNLPVSFYGSQDSSGTSVNVQGGTILRCGDSTGTGTTKACSVLIRPGGVGSASGTTGLIWHAETYYSSGTSTQYYLQCETANMTVGDCPINSTNPIGVNISASNISPVIVVTSGDVFVTATAGVTLGDYVCTGGTIGQVTDNAAATPCATAGKSVGIVVGTSGTFNLSTTPSDSSQAASTTLPVVHLRFQ